MHHTIVRLGLISWFVFIFIFSFSVRSFAQLKHYTSDVDQSLSINTIVVMPLVDNINGIYANNLNATLHDTIDGFKQWDIKAAAKDATKEGKASPEELESSPQTVSNIEKKSAAQAVIAGRITRGARGVSIKLSLYAGVDGLPVWTETLTDYPGFELADLKTQLAVTTENLIHRLPYQATTLSRKGQLITINMGSSLGLRPGMELTAIQIIKINRHPKYNFIVGTENLTLGKVRIEKTDEFLSFASVETERDANIITNGVKLTVDKFVTYPDMAKTADGKLITGANGADAPVAFGDHPKEWQPENPPTYGKAGILFGLGNYTINNTLASGSATGSSNVVPSIHVRGEMWLSTNWFLGLNLDSYVFSVSNGLSGSSPSTLNVSMTDASLSAGYNFLLNDDFFGPKLTVSMGYEVANMTVDGSTPTAFESTNYGGLDLGFGGEFPIAVADWQYPFVIGGKLNYFINPKMTESPTTSGASSSSQMTSFAVIGSHRIREHVNIRGELSFDLYNTSFSGTGTRAVTGSSSSQTITTLAGGVEYLF